MIEEAAEGKDEKKDNESNYTSGIESDNDLDLLVEQEVLEAVRIRKALKKELGNGGSEDDVAKAEIEEITSMADVKKELKNEKESE